MPTVHPKMNTRRPASTGIFLAQLHVFDQLLQIVKKRENSSDSFQKFLQAPIPPMISTVLGITDLLGLRSKALNSMFFSE